MKIVVYIHLIDRILLLFKIKAKSTMIERLTLKVLRIPNLDFFQLGDHEYLFMKFRGKIEEYYSDYS